MVILSQSMQVEVFLCKKKLYIHDINISLVP